MSDLNEKLKQAMKEAIKPIIDFGIAFLLNIPLQFVILGTTGDWLMKISPFLVIAEAIIIWAPTIFLTRTIWRRIHQR